ncbi:hypothetical protein N2152v2_004216 [Parachlorella kessleri]
MAAAIAGARAAGIAAVVAKHAHEQGTDEDFAAEAAPAGHKAGPGKAASGRGRLVSKVAQLKQQVVHLEAEVQQEQLKQSKGLAAAAEAAEASLRAGGWEAPLEPLLQAPGRQPLGEGPSRSVCIIRDKITA